MDEIMTIDEVAKYLKVTKKTIYYLIYQKSLPTVKLGSRLLRFRKSDIDKWLDAKANIKASDSKEDEKVRAILAKLKWLKY